MKSLDKIKINKIDKNVIRISKNSNLFDKSWNIDLENNQSINQDYIVICSALNTQKLLKPLGHEILLEPILGQVIELELKKGILNWKKWPAVLNYQSINFIPHNPKKIYIGATIENNTEPSVLHKEEMLSINKTAPEWIKKAKIIILIMNYVKKQKISYKLNKINPK